MALREFKTKYVTKYYDEEGRVVKEVSNRGEISEYEYNSKGRLIRAKYPSGLEEYWDYDYQGELVHYKNSFSDEYWIIDKMRVDRPYLDRLLAIKAKYEELIKSRV